MRGIRIVNLDLPVIPYSLFLISGREILLGPAFSGQGFLNVLVYDCPNLLQFHCLIFEYSPVPLFPNVPHYCTWNYLPENVVDGTLKRLLRPVA